MQQHVSGQYVKSKVPATLADADTVQFGLGCGSKMVGAPTAATAASAPTGALNLFSSGLALRGCVDDFQGVRRNSIGRMMKGIFCPVPPVPLTVMVPALKIRAMTPWSRASPSTRLWFSSRVWRLMNPRLVITRLEVTANSGGQVRLQCEQDGNCEQQQNEQRQEGPTATADPGPHRYGDDEANESRIPGLTKMPQCSFARWRTCSPAARLSST